MSPRSRDIQVGFCQAHQKRLYRSKRIAKQVRRRMTGHLNVYPCSEIPTMFHVGNLAKIVISGEATRGEVYGQDQVS